MKTSVLVTGATGFLGEHLCRALVEEGHIVRGLARSRSAVLEELGVEHVRGDVLNADEVDRALDGVSAVFHLAGAVSRDPGDAQRMMRLHVDGTRRVLEQMANAGVRRMILASTSGTIGVSTREEVLDESAPYAEQIVAGWPYYTSKIYQERLAFEHGADLGIEIVAVNPSLLLGPGDRRLSSTGDVRKFIKKQIPTIPDGGINFVDARDAAAAIAAALNKGRAGERYLLGGPNWTTKEFFARLGRVANVSPPRLKLPPKLNKWGASVIEELYRWRGKEPPIERISVEMAEHYWWIDSTKAQTELGFAPRDPQLTLVDTVGYLRRGVDLD
jgi:dihydroflavonol-4-reductase